VAVASSWGKINNS